MPLTVAPRWERRREGGQEKKRHSLEHDEASHRHETLACDPEGLVQVLVPDCDAADWRGKRGEEKAAMSLPATALSEVEEHERLSLSLNCYPLRGRPFGIAFVWSFSYLDKSGEFVLNIANDSASLVAEELQLFGFEVRPRQNVKKKYIMDEISMENIETLSHTYDCVLVYIAAVGDGECFLAIDNEKIYIKDIWKRFEEIGMEGKPKMLFMDLFESRSSYVDDIVKEFNLAKKLYEESLEDIALIQSQDTNVPATLLKASCWLFCYTCLIFCRQRKLDLHADLKAKEELKRDLPQPPSAGTMARVAVMQIPLRRGHATWSCLTYGDGMNAFCSLNDVLGSTAGGWAFNQVGQFLHNSRAVEAKALWGKADHIEAGDVVTITLDMVQGSIKLEVEGKFKRHQNRHFNQRFVRPADHSGVLFPAVSLCDIDDEIELLHFRYSEKETADEQSFAEFQGSVWDTRSSARGLRFEGRGVVRVEGEHLPQAHDAMFLIHRQPITRAPKAFTERGDPVGECFLGVFGVQDQDCADISPFAFSLKKHLRAALTSSDRQDEGPHGDEDENKARCLSDVLVHGIRRDLDATSLKSFLRGCCEISEEELSEASDLFRAKNLSINEVKKIDDKSVLEDLGFTSRQQIESIHRGIVKARNNASAEVHFLNLYSKSSFSRLFLSSLPPLAWSRQVSCDFLRFSPDACTVNKVGQSIASVTAIAALSSTLRAGKKFGAVLTGSGKHSWEFVIARLRSSQGGDEVNAGSIKLGIVQSDAVARGVYHLAAGKCQEVSASAVVLESSASSQDGAYEGMHLHITEGMGAGQVSRIFAYVGETRTAYIQFEAPVSAESSFYAVTKLYGFEVGDDVFSWAVASSSMGRSAIMHGNVFESSFKQLRFQGDPLAVNRVTAAGFELDNTYPRILGPALKEGDTLTVWLDLDTGVLAFSLNGERLGESVEGVRGPVLPAFSCPSSTDCSIQLRNYRRWAPESGWMSSEEAENMGFSEEEVEALKQIFRFDPPDLVAISLVGSRKNESNAELKIADIRKVFAELGLNLTDADMQGHVQAVDVDGSGRLDQIEFLHLISNLKLADLWSLDKLTAHK
ncbi:hypothetical protein GUITHDRAFT_166016, partial [Guillardia theta CCMP2712]